MREPLIRKKKKSSRYTDSSMVEIKLLVMDAKSEGYCERNGMGRVNRIVNIISGMMHIIKAIGRGSRAMQVTYLTPAIKATYLVLVGSEHPCRQAEKQEHRALSAIVHRLHATRYQGVGEGGERHFPDVLKATSKSALIFSQTPLKKYFNRTSVEHVFNERIVYDRNRIDKYYTILLSSFCCAKFRRGN